MAAKIGFSPACRSISSPQCPWPGAPQPEAPTANVPSPPVTKRNMTTVASLPPNAFSATTHHMARRSLIVKPAMENQLDIEQKVNALSLEVMAQRHDLHSLRAELKVQSVDGRRRSPVAVDHPIIEETMLRLNKVLESRVRELEEHLTKMVSNDIDAKFTKFRSVCDDLESTLREAIATAVAIEREDHERHQAETHAAMVAHGTFVVSRLEELASTRGHPWSDEGQSTCELDKMTGSVCSGQAQASRSGGTLDRIEEEMSPLSDGSISTSPRKFFSCRDPVHPGEESGAELSAHVEDVTGAQDAKELSSSDKVTEQARGLWAVAQRMRS